jgi:hypothetical protein
MRTSSRNRWRRLSSLIGVSSLVAAAVTGLASGTPAQAAVTSHPGVFHPVASARILDTTAAAGGTVSVTAVGAKGVPATGVGAVVLNVTVASPVHGGFLTVFPFGTTRPTTSNLNFEAHRTVANLVTVQLGGGKVSLYNASTGSARVIADISGYYEDGTPTDPGAFQSLAPARVLDTRSGLGATAASAAAHQTASVLVAGQGGVPATGAAAVVLNVTVATPASAGYATVFPSGGTRPGTSTLNFPAGRTVPNLVAVKLGPDGKVDFYNGSLGGVRFIADVFGYYLDGSPSRAGAFTSLPPTRIMDTRHALGVSAVVPARGTVRLDVNAKGGLPPYGGGGIALNVTATGARTSGYVTVYPSDATRPTTSNLNYVAGQTVANLVVVRPSGDGHVSFSNSSSGTVHLIADVSGSFVPAPAIHFRGSETMVDVNGRTSMSCASATLCLASTTSGRVSRYDGSTWSAPQSLFTGDEVIHISCGSATFCLAVTRLGDSRVFNGTSWSTHVGAGTVPILGTTTLSCGAPTLCLLGGTFDNKIHRFNGTAWSSISSPGGLIFALSCASATFCVAVDHLTKAYRFNGAAWSTGTQLAGAVAGLSCSSSSFCLYRNDEGLYQRWTGAAWAAAQGGAGSGDGGSVSCLSSTFCIVGGQDGVGVYNGTTWSAPGGLATGGGLQQADCVSTTSCASIGEDGYAATLTGTTWSAEVAVDPAFGTPTAVSCAAAPFCAVVSNTGAVVTRGASGWSLPHGLQRAVPMTAVSCASASFCVAIEAGSAHTFNGTSWSAPVHLADSESLSFAFCPTTSFCLVSDGSTYYTYNGTSWAAGASVEDPSTGSVPSGPISMTCPSASYCAITRSGGQLEEWDGTPGAFWTNVAPPGLSQPFVSCASASFCAAVDHKLVTLRVGATWSTPASVAISFDNFTRVSCLTSTFCVATSNGRKNAYTYEGESWAITTTSPLNLGIFGCGTPTFCLGVSGNLATVGTPT